MFDIKGNFILNLRSLKWLILVGLLLFKSDKNAIELAKSQRL